MNKNPDNELLAKYISGECTPDEKELVEFWINADTKNHEIMRRLKAVWKQPQTESVIWDRVKLWNKITEATGIQSEQRKSRTRIFPLSAIFIKSGYLRAAAVVIALIVIPFLMQTINGIKFGDDSFKMVEVRVEPGEKQIVELADGSRITLDAGSVLSYNEDFGNDSREVNLTGEGFFEVNSDHSKPFTVTTDNAIAEVLGTKFNLRSWPESDAVRLVVAEGLVSFRPSRASENDTILVAANQISAVFGTNRLLRPVNVDVQPYLEWQNRHLNFDNASLDEIIAQLERWYKVDISLQDNRFGSERLTIHTENRPLADILELIGSLADLSYEIRGDNILLQSHQ